MDKKTKLAWLKRYSETNAVSGFEAPMKELLQERLAGKAEVSYDKLGSVVFTNASADENAPRIMLASHMDEIGFMVKHITKEGFFKIRLPRRLVGAGYAWPARYRTRQQRRFGGCYRQQAAPYFNA